MSQLFSRCRSEGGSESSKSQCATLIEGNLMFKRVRKNDEANDDGMVRVHARLTSKKFCFNYRGRLEFKERTLLTSKIELAEVVGKHLPVSFMLSKTNREDKNYLFTTHSAYSLFRNNSIHSPNLNELKSLENWLFILYRIKYQHVGGGIFGTQLSVVMDTQTRLGWRDTLPRLVVDCVRYLTQRDSVELMGIFSPTDKLFDIVQLRAAYQRGERPSDVTRFRQREVAGLLKHFVSALPDPVVTAEVQAECNKLLKKKRKTAGTETVRELKKLVAKLPVYNRRLLHRICQIGHTLYELIELNGKQFAVEMAESLFKCKPEHTAAAAAAAAVAGRNEENYQVEKNCKHEAASVGKSVTNLNTKISGEKAIEILQIMVKNFHHIFAEDMEEEDEDVAYGCQ